MQESPITQLSTGGTQNLVVYCMLRYFELDMADTFIAGSGRKRRVSDLGSIAGEPYLDNPDDKQK